MSYSKNKGMTLIEIIVTLGIIFSIMWLSVLSIRNIQKFIINKSVRVEEQGMVDFIQEARLVCMENKCDGEVIVDCIRDRLIFTLENKIICKFQCDKYIDLYGLNINGGEYSNFIKIRKDGYVSPSSILFKNEIGEERRITSRVNLGYVQIK